MKVSKPRRAPREREEHPLKGKATKSHPGMRTVPFYKHDLKPDDAKSVADVINSLFLTTGSVCSHVHKQLESFFDVKHALLTSSWTSGAIAALLALKVGPGDEVIIPAMTFVATANVAELVGARPIFIDVDPQTLLMTPEAVSAALTARTRAVIPVHLYGNMCDIGALRSILPQSVALIEDAAHCFEGSRDGYLPGANSDVAIFSFYATKNVTCGEGGAVIGHDSGLMQTIAQIRLHGMTTAAIDRFRGNSYQHWDQDLLGIKANLPDLLAALLPAQIETIRSRLPRRAQIAARYRSAFAEGPIRLVREIPSVVDAHHLFVIHVPPPVRDSAIAILNEHGIQVTVNYRSVPTMRYYARKYDFKFGDFPVADEWGAGTISLPFFPALTEDDQAYVIETVAKHVYPLCRNF
jgi:UDP-4-amino-4-deoxy-L-arabinose-oxoglutarate aminotransferase